MTRISLCLVVCLSSLVRCPEATTRVSAETRKRSKSLDAHTLSTPRLQCQWH